MRSTRSRPRAVLALTLACAVLVAGIQIATAHEYSANATAKIDSGGPDGAEGTVRSRRDRCENHRKVKLYREQEGDDEFFGSAFTDMNGNWEIVAALVAGDYYVLVTRLLAGSGDHRHLCRAARSVSVSL